MALSRLHLLLNKPPPHPFLPPSSFFSPLSSSFHVSSRRPRPIPRFSFARRLLCSKSDPPTQVRTSRVSPFWIPPPPSIPLISLLSIQSDPRRGEPAPSIVGDLLDYLNESWTQFHATGKSVNSSIRSFILFLFRVLWSDAFFICGFFAIQLKRRGSWSRLVSICSTRMTSGICGPVVGTSSLGICPAWWLLWLERGELRYIVKCLFNKFKSRFTKLLLL